MSRALGARRRGVALVDVSIGDCHGATWALKVRVTEPTGAPDYLGEVQVIAATSGKRTLDGEGVETALWDLGVKLDGAFEEAVEMAGGAA